MSKKINYGFFLIAFWAYLPAFSQMQFLSKVPLKPVIDFGFLQFNNPPSGYQLDFLGSRNFNIALLTTTKLGQSGISVHTGVGFGTDNYVFQEKYLLQTNLGNVNFIRTTDTEKIKLSANYVDIPFELRWVSGMGRKVFRITAGAKVGFLFDTHLKIVQNDQTSKIKRDLYVQPIRYGVYGRLGYNWYNLYFYYSLSELFQKNRTTIALQPFTIGLSLNTF